MQPFVCKYCFLSAAAVLIILVLVCKRVFSRAHSCISCLSLRTDHQLHQCVAPPRPQAKGKTSEAITKLCQLAPPTAVLLELDTKVRLTITLYTLTMLAMLR